MQSPVLNAVQGYLPPMQLDMFQKQIQIPNLKEDLFQAYFDARKNKRNTINALKFELHFEENIFRLHEEIISGEYKPCQSICYMVHKPVMREIFAANFRDRIVHHFIINKLNPLFEKQFIYDSYACRLGKGTHLGIQRIDRFIRKCSQNYSRDCYILKLDVEGFFMHINRKLLMARLEKFIQQKYQQADITLIIDLCKKVVFNDSTKNCIIKGAKKDWAGLPKNKSLFHSPTDCGLPIGNLTSQVLANFYMNDFDHYVKRDLGIKNYGRYVDDFFIVHPDKEYLKSIMPTIKTWLMEHLHLNLHPKKIYLQHFKRGVKFLGAIIKPHRVYIASRTKGNFYIAIAKQNAVVRYSKPTKQEQQDFLSSMNAYLGIMKHYKTYHLRKHLIFKNLSAWWWNYVYLKGGICKFAMK